MSCTIAALPFLLIYAIVTSSSKNAENESSHKAYDKEEIKRRLRAEMEHTLVENNGEVTEEQIEQLCKEYRTVFMDKDILIKTLQEYGLKDFSMKDDTISARVENFNIIFYREDSTKPYMLRVYSSTSCDETVIVDDLNSEYALNVQEETYIKIKERLSKRNLNIDEEEILEDDSIMITVNLD